MLRKNTCLFVWLFAFVMVAALRTVEMLVLTEYDTGFIIPAYKPAAVIITAAVGVAVLVSSVFISVSTKKNTSQKGFSSLTGLSSFMLGVAAGFGAFYENYAGVPAILKTLCMAFALLACLYFVAFGVRVFVHFPFSSRLSVIPALFFVFKAAAVAITGAYHTVISDSIFNVAAYCFIMLFFLEFVRAANGSAQSGGARRFAALGTAASLLSLTASVPKIIISAILPSALHDSPRSEYLLFFAGLYIACEVFLRLCFIEGKDEKISLYYVGKH